jgi:uncharacterized protein YcgI (DUF1989 family)
LRIFITRESRAAAIMAFQWRTIRRPRWQASKASRVTQRLLARYAETARGQPRQLAQSFIIPARTGKAFPLMAGKIVRVSCVEGPQVADMIVFNLHDPNEKFWSGRTRVIHGGHLKVGDRLWSVPPQVRQMLTLIAVTAFLSLAL